MQKRGNANDNDSTGRLAISRRSCDQCRTRKIRCSRESPCSNCTAARLDCTHSTIASNATPSRQRVSLSTQYEDKIDEIAKGIHGLQALLQGSQASYKATSPHSAASWYPDKTDIIKYTVQQWPNGALAHKSQPGQATYITKFIRDMVYDDTLRSSSDEDRRTILTLEKFLKILDNSGPIRRRSLSGGRLPAAVIDQRMPPLEASLAVLRWAKTYHSCGRVFWLSRVLPQEKFVETCRKVYFAVEDYDNIDLALANAYLFYVFTEHAIEHRLQSSQEYGDLCRKNFHDVMVQLPLLLRPSLEAIAALTLGAFHAMEDTTVSLAWTYISTALNLCQTLGFHRASGSGHSSQPSRAVQAHLFWTVYRFERSLALRTDRSSNIRDTDITIPVEPVDAYFSKLGKINGQIYDLLYSPAALSNTNQELRMQTVNQLTKDLRELIGNQCDEIAACQRQVELPSSMEFTNNHTQISPCTGSDCSESSPRRLLYMQFDLICHYSSLALVLRAMPPLQNAFYDVSDDCVAVARLSLDTHEHYMDALRQSDAGPALMKKYIGWVIVNAPFVPFNILFTRVIQLFDIADLERLERFAASLQPETTSSELGTYPCQLYEILCRAARMYVTRAIGMEGSGPNLTDPSSATFQDLDLTRLNSSMVVEGMQNGGQNDEYDMQAALSDWFHENQQVMGLLSEDFMF